MERFFTQDEDYQDAAEQLFGIDDELFDDAELEVIEQELDVDQAVDQLYNMIYEGDQDA